MTPMVAERSSTVAVAATAATETSGAAAQPAKPAVRRPGPPRPTFAEIQQSPSFYRPDYRRPPAVQQQQQFSFPSLFSGPSWFSRRW